MISFGNCSSAILCSPFLVDRKWEFCRNLFKGTVHKKLPSRMVLYRGLMGAHNGSYNSPWKPLHRYNWGIADGPLTYQHSPKHCQGTRYTHSAASFATNHAIPQCSDIRLSLGGQSLGREHGSSRDGGLLKEEGWEAMVGFKFQFICREMDDE